MHPSKFFYCIAGIVFLFASCNPTEKKANPPTDSTSIAAIKNAIKEYPDSLILKQNLIEAYRNEGEYDSAIAIVDKEIAKDSTSAYLWNIKATLYFENNDTLSAAKALQHAIDIYPLPEYLVALGTVFAEIKNERALQIADNLLRSNKEKHGKDAYFIKGLYYNYLNEPQKAIVYLDSCLNLDFTYMYAYREKGIALYQEKKYEEAIKVLSRGVTLQNNFDEGYYWMGKCYEKLNEKDEAIQSYQNALLYDKDFIEARKALERLQQEK